MVKMCIGVPRNTNTPGVGLVTLGSVSTKGRHIFSICPIRTTCASVTRFYWDERNRDSSASVGDSLSVGCLLMDPGPRRSLPSMMWSVTKRGSVELIIYTFV